MASKRYTDNDIILGASQVKSIAGLLSYLGLKPTGGNYSNIKRKLQTLHINTDHWTGAAWSKGEQLKDWKDYTRASNFKKHLIRLRGNVCECCNLTTWLNKLIKLELHHIDGNRTNNNAKNLQLLCPNCHSYTDTWRNNKAQRLDTEHLK
jgi:hypothetical protein